MNKVRQKSLKAFIIQYLYVYNFNVETPFDIPKSIPSYFLMNEAYFFQEKFYNWCTATEKAILILEAKLPLRPQAEYPQIILVDILNSTGNISFLTSKQPVYRLQLIS